MKPLLGYRQFNNEFDISPGGVGSVGQTVVQQRYKRSAPDMPVLLESNVGFGSNITDGNNQSMYTIGPVARVAQGGWAYRNQWITNRGFEIEDCRGADRLTMPLPAGTNQWDWQNKVGRAFNMTGNNFLPLPGAYQLPPGATIRGQEPQVINIATPAPQLVDWQGIAVANLNIA